MSEEVKEENTPKRPARLDIVDMPRDKERALGGLRQALCASFNYCRKYPHKLKTLRTVLAYVVERIDTYTEELEAKNKADDEAREKAKKAADERAKAKAEAAEKSAPAAAQKASATKEAAPKATSAVGAKVSNNS